MLSYTKTDKKPSKTKPRLMTYGYDTLERQSVLYAGYYKILMTTKDATNCLYRRTENCASAVHCVALRTTL